ncbi:MAG: sugar phosphate isomerase/epimerase [Verrucomicrobiae bacterium]|nr:sugar phosphate isomerase/epimerase [Verrucomicrobiae bacterium]
MTAPYEIGLMLGDVSKDPEGKFGLLRQLGVRCCQIWLGRRVLTPALEKRVAEITLREQIEITTVFCGFEGDRYDDLATARATIGLVPEVTRAERLAEMKEVGLAVRRLGVPAVGLHIGFIPTERGSSAYRGVVAVAQEIADFLAERGLKLTLETGQETGTLLRDFLGDLKRSNVGVNFDPANMLLYGHDQPIPAVEKLAPWLYNVHAKDGSWPTEPGRLGHEMPIGQGQVRFPEFLRKLREVGYRGPLIIEREISGPQQIEDMRVAIQFLNQLTKP